MTRTSRTGYGGWRPAWCSVDDRPGGDPDRSPPAGELQPLLNGGTPRFDPARQVKGEASQAVPLQEIECDPIELLRVLHVVQVAAAFEHDQLGAGDARRHFPGIQRRAVAAAPAPVDSSGDEGSISDSSGGGDDDHGDDVGDESSANGMYDDDDEPDEFDDGYGDGYDDADDSDD
ncbi:MAG: hypothetical protein QF541_10170, partial [Lentisphaeria bacterium]|nr:hypothetical protein [Lentisphaeria bacterium]